MAARVDTPGQLVHNENGIRTLQERTSMRLHELTGIKRGTRVTALVGGGGKTTAMLALAAEAAAAGRRTVVTTTTHIFPPRGDGFALVTDGDTDAVRRGWEQGLIVAAGQPMPDGRLARPDEAVWDHIMRTAEAVYIEADGSKGLPLKYPAAWEPALPPEAEQVLLLTGLSALDKPVDGYCHRAELIRRELGVDQPVIDEELMARVLAAGYGRFYPLVVINQADTEELAARGRKLACLLAELGLTRSVVLSLHELAVGAGES